MKRRIQKQPNYQVWCKLPYLALTYFLLHFINIHIPNKMVMSAFKKKKENFKWIALEKKKKITNR